MARSANKVDVYLEGGKKRTFAGAVDWPGWCRSGRDEESALRALLQYGPRYARVVGPAKRKFRAPTALSSFIVVERLKGDVTTDFGSPGMAPSNDKKRLGQDDLARLESILKACWRAFDATAKRAKGKELRKGPRGGGRDLEGIIQHVLGAEQGYFASVGWKLEKRQEADLNRMLARTREAALQAIAASARGEIEAIGPRGGVRWSPRYFVRRESWHVLDHLWEIEDRVV